MTKLKNIWHRLLGLSFCLLLCISFFNWLSIKSVQAAPPSCGAYLGTGTCNNGLAKQLADSLNPPAHNWTCTADGQTIDCSKGINMCGNGNIDFSEECDGNNLGSASCADWNATGNLFCTATCRFDSSKCIRATCGDGKVEGFEQCEKGVNITQRCEDLNPNYHSGVVTCGDNCNFNTNTCLSCGNNKIESYGGTTETCDGTDFAGKTCADFGTPPFTNGTLKCIGTCGQIDTSGCNRSLCGNGMIDGTEECDGTNLGVPAKTCASSGCTGGGPVKCQANCTLDKTTCTGCAATKCSAVTSSPWSNPFVINVPCCGATDGDWAKTLSANSTGLCAGEVKNFKTLYTYDLRENDSSAIKGWTWNCGDADVKCQAYKEPECATEIANVSSDFSCSSAKVYKNKAEYEKTVSDRKATRYADGQLKNSLCDGGYISYTGQENCLDEDGNVDSTLKGMNAGYRCANVNDKFEYKETQCLAGWPAPSTCGTVNNKTYTATATDNCKDDAEVIKFFGLAAKGNSTELCEQGNVALAASKIYRAGSSYYNWVEEIGDKYIVGKASYHRSFKRWFDWSCQSAGRDGRKGEVVQCHAKLDDTKCSSLQPAQCGPAVQGRFAYAGPGPTRDFCSFGMAAYSNITFSEETKTWSWYCLPVISGTNTILDNFNPVQCSVSASVYCGDADGGVYDSANEARESGLCGGTNATLAEDIHSTGNNWAWVCADDRDESVNVHCSASSRKCGYADSHDYTMASFDANKSRANFLCDGNLTPTVSLSDDFPSQWTWSCGANNCSATLLECGWGGVNAYNDNYYTQAEFAVKKTIYETFICSNGLAAVKNFSQSNDLGGQSATDGYDPGWLWSCVGDAVTPGGAKDKLLDASCMAHENKCGYFNNYSVSKDLFDSYKDLPDKYEYFCTYGYRPEFTTLSGGAANSNWYCVNASDRGTKNDRISCGATHPACGTAVSSGASYYQGSIDKHLANLGDGFLCNGNTESFPRNISKNSLGRWSWTCGGSSAFSELSGTANNLNVQTCTAGVAGCGTAHNTELDGAAAWNACKSGNDNNCLCTENKYAKLRYPVINFRNGLYEATWSCLDSDGDEGGQVCRTSYR